MEQPLAVQVHHQQSRSGTLTQPTQQQKLIKSYIQQYNSVVEQKKPQQNQFQTTITNFTNYNQNFQNKRQIPVKKPVQKNATMNMTKTGLNFYGDMNPNSQTLPAQKGTTFLNITQNNFNIKFDI